jgi:hypothetical protein
MEQMTESIMALVLAEMMARLEAKTEVGNEKMVVEMRVWRNEM